jgi:lysophospholipase L1-like esterase
MAVEVVPCSGHLGCVDLRDPRYPDADGLHLTSAEWQEFAEAIKAGKYDELTDP